MGSPKQNQYYTMLMKIADYRMLSTIDELTDETRGLLRQFALQADLLHKIPAAIMNEGVDDHDVDFLNGAARYYLRVTKEGDINRLVLKFCISQLFIIVRHVRAADLTWPGPEINDEERRILGVSLE